MKKLFLLSAMITLSTGAWAQDDMYFVPSKKNIEKEITAQSLPKDTYYSGSDRSVDDYNRRSVYQSIDSLGNDIIEFNTSKGGYPVDSLSEDYQVTRRMERFDGYTVKVFSSRGQSYNLISDAGIVDARWIGDAVIVTFRNGSRVRFYGPYGNQYESIY